MFKGKKVYIPTKTWKVIGFLINTTPKVVFDFLSSILAPGRYDKK